MTEIDISFNDEVDFFSDTRKNWKTWIEELILSAKKNIKKTNRQEMSINFVDINKIHEINKNYRGKDIGFGFSNGYCCGTSSILFLPSSILFLQPISVAFGTLIHGVSIICKGCCAPAKICWHTFYPFGVKVWLPTPTFHFYYTNVPFHLYVLLPFHCF